MAGSSEARRAAPLKAEKTMADPHAGVSQGPAQTSPPPLQALCLRRRLEYT